MAVRAAAGDDGVASSSTELAPSELAANRFAASRIAVEPTLAELGRELQTRDPPETREARRVGGRDGEQEGAG